MGRKKKNIITKELPMVNDEEKNKLARERRIRKAGLTSKQVDCNNREEFRKYFTKIKRVLNLSSDLEEVIWLHLKAIHCDKKDKFDAGLEHFGYKLNK